MGVPHAGRLLWGYARRQHMESRRANYHRVGINTRQVGEDRVYTCGL